MDWLKPVQASIANWWAYIDWCLGADILAPVCQPFWTWTFGALLGVGALVVVWMVVKLISYRMKLSAALRAEAERAKIADEDTIRAHAWEGDNAYQTDLDPEEVRRRIKDALVARGNEQKPPPVV